jgi:hypothetical protein
MEKVIQDFKVIETDDGFRIEIKGDKEAIREMWGNFGPRAWRGRKHKHGRDFGFGFGPHFWTHFGGGCGHGTWEEEAQQEESTQAG